ncbi:Sugar kinases, ribokinase family [Streptomyces sp. PgraA7]|nr:hypothetical protein [Streptomyces sp. SID8378]SNB87195.1 Sugar kinases, ribokinase family [Streptomyces sp. PgraA7]
MRITVTGSIATDHLMSFPGRFRDLLLPGQLDHVSLSFLTDGLEIRQGGVAANIATGLARLGLRPVLVGAAGRDFAEYAARLEGAGVDTGSVLISENLHTARFLCTTDADHNQVAARYAGAMTEARKISLAAVGPVVKLPSAARRLARTLAALPKCPGSSATRPFRRLAIARTRRRAAALRATTAV